jgi:hypothetical protein
MKNLEKLENFIDNLKNSAYVQASVDFEKCVEYLRSDDPTIPVFTIQNYWVITGFEQLLGDVDEWDEWEDKIMALMTQPSIGMNLKHWDFLPMVAFAILPIGSVNKYSKARITLK